MQHFKLSFVAVCGALALAACGGDDSPPISGTPDSGVLLIDAGIDGGTGPACSTTEQDCTNAAEKCTVTINAANEWSTVCREIKPNPIALNTECMRDSEGNAGVGRDNCDKGLYCTALGNPDGTSGLGHQTCRAFCRATSACVEGFECMSLTDLEPQDGICIDPCEPLGEGCDGEATPPAWCQPKDNILGVSRGICVQAGEIAQDAACGGDIEGDCVANTLCVGNDTAGFTCRPICTLNTADFPCAGGATCEAINGFATDFGTCPVAAANGQGGKLRVGKLPKMTSEY